MAKFWLGLVIAIVFFLTGCSRATLNSQAQGPPELVESILVDPKTFNSILSQESPNIFGLTFVGSLTENPLTGEQEPVLAESWQFSEDKLKLIFTLRQGLQWSDGQPLTVHDVVFTYNQLYLNESIPTNARDILRVGDQGTLPTVRQLDERRVEFTIAEPFAPFLGNMGLAILPAHILEPIVQETTPDGRSKFLDFWGVDTPPEQLVVNGPYKLSGYRTGERLIFTKNPYFWRSGLPHIERVVWQIVESTDTAFLQFRSGGLDSLGVSPEYFSLLKREEQRGNFTIYNGGPAYGTVFISFNLNKGRRNGQPLVDPLKSRWFNKVNFRRAIAYAIDRERMINNIYRGLGSKQNSPISVQSPFYDQSLESYEYQPEVAKQLLLAEGFQYNSAGKLLDEAGHPVRFSLITNAGNKTREAMGAQIKEDLSKIGITVDFNPIAFNVLVDKLSNSLDWECHLLGFTGGNEPNGGASLWFTDGNLHVFNQKPQPGRTPLEGREIAPWEEQIAQLYREGTQELDFEKRKAIYAQAQQLVATYLPFIYLVNPLSLGAVRDRFQGIEYSALGGAFWNLEELKITSTP